MRNNTGSDVDFDFNQGYELPADVSIDETRQIETAMIAGMQMNDAAGLRLPFHIPPAVALAVVRALAPEEERPVNYANQPLSIAELRSDKTESARDWKPRDALISVLREIDSGEIDPEVLVIAMKCTDAKGKERFNYRVSSPDPFLTFGLLSYAAMEFHADTGK